MRVGFYALLFASAALLASTAPLPNPPMTPAQHYAQAIHHEGLARHHTTVAEDHRQTANLHDNRIKAAKARYNAGLDPNGLTSAQKHQIERDHHLSLAAQAERHAATHNREAAYHRLHSQTPAPGTKRSIDELD
ncbi:hypothetical protein PIIN_05872 [Serendipita indica DSM 11827]|uniref:DUF4148 domain-containing protein n=1 Tax=Serendipita indica (strain DSM 11827) TaxID=1109443 RepID=G4TKU4_SERID|nr:hypothetical protein PIIN_05872 [Serendipita indica DSM 11827]